MKETRDSIADVWGPRTPYRDQWPVRVDERTVAQPDRWVPSACLLCSYGCGIDIGVKDGRIVGVRGRESDRTNHGRLGPKGLHGWAANHSADRLTTPLIRRKGELQPASWDEAMDLIVRRSKELIDRHTGNSIAFYTSGQLYLEEYYTLGIIGKAGIGTPHMDGNTRLCTATADFSLKESFGTDGQPGSYEDVDLADALMLVGHNVASQQTVMWMRILDRRAGPNPPKLVVIDPRRTDTAKEADVHLALRLGTNVALLNGLQHLLIKHGWIDRSFIETHTVGFEKLAHLVSTWTSDRVERVTGVPQRELMKAAEIIGRTPRLMSTVLQGVYQSMQATAAAVQINNIQLLRGMIGKPGCTVLQMNGQPTAENTRECGADGDFPAFRNWENEDHMQEMARIWNVERAKLPTYAPPTHAMQIFRYAEEGTVKMLWISGTNPAVSLPELARIRRILNLRSLFVVVQDAFRTETTEHADVVLPAALWGEKTGCYTNVDRTVHLSEKAIEPPGQATSDFDIFVDYARRMNFSDKDGAPLVKWATPEDCFEAWKLCSKGRPCDYSGMSYAKLRGSAGIQWPCTEQAPNGTPRLYNDHRFNTQADYCETYGHDLTTGAVNTPEKYRARDPQGKAFLHAVEYQPPHEEPDEDYPFRVTTGRIVYHWHTRTKTGRSRELNEAAPDAFIQMHEDDAARLGVRDGDWVEVASRRGHVTARAKLGDILPGHLFIPFHYGYWDDPDRARAANELTLTEWDPVSKQPYFKFSAARAKKVSGAPIVEKVAQVAESVTGKLKNTATELMDMPGKIAKAVSTADDERPVNVFLGMAFQGERHLVEAFKQVAQQHMAEPDIHATCRLMASWSQEQAEGLKPFIAAYHKDRSKDPEGSVKSLFEGPRSGGLGLLRDLHDLWLAANEVHLDYEAVKQAAKALHDQALVETCERHLNQTDRQLAWLRTRIDQASPQTLVVS
ncbi:molybdopterin oxidoreductase family protein [Nitrospira moscoviensis]|uniref:Molybdopterin oxidoreductase n=1 Tax=Nitrospira moscoviensis TaxID=42253 RepID=A0A0K2GE66_NITMO|nr:nitrate reductase [Nitrospira moscoviensis]ALA59246.1 Molybdopterin oxidoreductase [Nitrospira moscoviensis]